MRLLAHGPQPRACQPSVRSGCHLPAAGDHAAVLAENSEAVVEAAARVLGLPLSHCFRLRCPSPNGHSLPEPPSAGPLTLRGALARHADLLSAPNKAALLALAACARDAGEAARLRRLASIEGAPTLGQRRVDAPGRRHAGLHRAGVREDQGGSGKAGRWGGPQPVCARPLAPRRQGRLPRLRGCSQAQPAGGHAGLPLGAALAGWVNGWGCAGARCRQLWRASSSAGRAWCRSPRRAALPAASKPWPTHGIVWTPPRRRLLRQHRAAPAAPLLLNLVGAAAAPALCAHNVRCGAGKDAHR